MTYTQDRGLKLAYFMIGIAIPMVGYVLWSKTDGFSLGGRRKAEVDAAHDVTVEDSFPASDPPSAW